MRTIPETLLHGSAAAWTDLGRRGLAALIRVGRRMRPFQKFPTTIPTLIKRLAFFYREERNEEKIQIVVEPDMIKGDLAAVRAVPGKFAYSFNFWCYPAHDKKHFQ